MKTDDEPGNSYIRSRIDCTCAFAYLDYSSTAGYTPTALGITLRRQPFKDSRIRSIRNGYRPMCGSQSIIDSPFAKYYVPNVTAANTYMASFTFLQSGPLQRISLNQIDWVPLVGDATLLEAQKGAEEGMLVQGLLTFYWPSCQFVVPINNAMVAQLVIKSKSNDPHPFHL